LAGYQVAAEMPSNVMAAHLLLIQQQQGSSHDVGGGRCLPHDAEP
jgi:hypothetical protein